MSDFLRNLAKDLEDSAKKYVVGALSDVPPTVASDGSKHTAGQAQSVAAVPGTVSTAATTATQTTPAWWWILAILAALGAVIAVVVVLR